MIVETLQWINRLSGPNTIMGLDGQMFTDKILYPVKEELPAALGLATLSGFADAVAQKVGGYDPDNAVVVVRAYDRAELVSVGLDTRGRRVKFLSAVCEPFICKFPFGRFMPTEEFIIGLLANFVPTGDLTELLRVASNLTAEQVAISEDDGISQKATTRAGIVLKSTYKVRPRVLLAPFRTFPEIDQPISDFLFRLRSEKDQPPTCALFQADGARWEQAAMFAIRDWLAPRVGALKVIA